MEMIRNTIRCLYKVDQLLWENSGSLEADFLITGGSGASGGEGKQEPSKVKGVICFYPLFNGQRILRKGTNKQIGLGSYSLADSKLHLAKLPSSGEEYGIGELGKEEIPYDSVYSLCKLLRDGISAIKIDGN
jgi:hypothetical protein